MKTFRCRNLLTAISILLFSAVIVLAQRTPAPLTPKEQELADYIKSNYTKREVMIPMRDGVKLFTSIYEPKDRSQKYPIIMNRTPYSVAPYGEAYKTLLGPDELFAKEGYIFVYQDVRGRWMSEGQFVDVRPEVAQNK